jgi:hypothetical protein
MAEREYTVVAPDGKEVTLIGPVGASQAEVIAQAQKLYKPTPIDRGNVINTDVPTVVGSRPNAVNPQPAQAPRSMGDYVKSLYEVPATVLSGAVAPFIGVGAGIAQNIRQGTNERVDRPELAQRFTYEPTSPVSIDALESLGSTLEAAKLPVYIPTLGTAARATRQSARTTAPLVSGNLPSFDQASQAVRTTPSRIADLLREREAPVMSGVGAAEVPDAQVRMARALNLPVPIKLSKGEALRELGQQQFEAEIAKTYPKDVGRPLIAGKMNRNEQLLQNFDAFVDATGAKEAGEFNLRQVGQVVDSALVNEANRVKKKITDLYTIAREKGETQEPVSYASLKTYIEQQTPTVRTKLAPILDAVDEQIKLNDPKGTGAISINQIEDIFQFINKNYDPTDAVANVHVRAMKDAINAATEGKGGEYYQTARAMRAKYAREFENVGYIDKLLSKKKGTSDRAVALADVFDHSIMKGSLDDVRSIGRTLKKAGPEGEQAWKELQGQTIEEMKSLVSKSVQRDEFGNPIVSPAKFDGFVRQLDAEGKLDYLFGKKGAQQIRDLRDTTLDINVPMLGINQSNSSSAVTQALDRVKSSLLGKIPMAGPIFEMGAEIVEKKKLAKEVKEALDFDPKALSKELKKGK